MDDMTRSRRRRVLVAALPVTVLLLAGCAGGDDVEDGQRGGTSYEPDRSAAVAGDPDASVEDIVGAGRVTRVGVTGTGEVLVSYLVSSDDDEGPQASAWRLYDAQGDRVAEGRGVRLVEQGASPQVWSTPDGVLLRPNYAKPRWELVRPDGEVVRVTNSQAPTPTRPGDVALDQLRFYRPSGATTYRYAERRPDERRALDITVDELGGVWALVDRRDRTPDVLHSDDGAAPWTSTSLDLAEGDGYPDRVEVAGDTVVVPVIGGDAGNRLVAVLHRPVSATTGPWTAADLTGLDPRDWYAATVTALPDGSLVLADQVPWVGTVDGGWTRVVLPEADGDAGPGASFLGPAGDLLVAATFEGTGLEVSDDLGRTWTPWPR